MPARSAFEYAIIRLVPQVERGECINVGVVLFCRGHRFLSARIELDRPRLLAFAPQLDLPFVEAQLGYIPVICAGGVAAGPLGVLPQAERFRWLAAPRSTIVQTSPVHCGLCADPQRALQQLVQTMVLPASASV